MIHKIRPRDLRHFGLILVLRSLHCEREYSEWCDHGLFKRSMSCGEVNFELTPSLLRRRESKPISETFFEVSCLLYDIQTEIY